MSIHPYVCLSVCLSFSLCTKDNELQIAGFSQYFIWELWGLDDNYSLCQFPEFSCHRQHQARVVMYGSYMHLGQLISNINCVHLHSVNNLRDEGNGQQFRLGDHTGYTCIACRSPAKKSLAENPNKTFVFPKHSQSQ